MPKKSIQCVTQITEASPESQIGSGLNLLPWIWRSMPSSSNFPVFPTLYSLFYPLLYFFTKILPLILSESGVFWQTESKALTLCSFCFKIKMKALTNKNSVLYYNRERVTAYVRYVITNKHDDEQSLIISTAHSSQKSCNMTHNTTYYTNLQRGDLKWTNKNQKATWKLNMGSGVTLFPMVGRWAVPA